LIETIEPQGSCEFVDAFAHILPVVMFLGIIDLPIERREDFLTMGGNFARATDNASRDKHLAPIAAYLGQVIDERHANPGDDMLSAIPAWRDNPRFGGEEEVMGMAFLIFFGGLVVTA